MDNKKELPSLEVAIDAWKSWEERALHSEKKLGEQIDELRRELLEAQQAKEAAELKVKRLRARLSWAAEWGV